MNMPIGSANSTFNYYDMHALQDFKQNVKSDKKNDLEVVASQLESVFLNMVLKSMREAEECFKSDLFESSGNDFYQDMLDHQLSLSLSQTKSIGLKEMIVQQLQGQEKK